MKILNKIKMFVIAASLVVSGVCASSAFAAGYSDAECQTLMGPTYVSKGGTCVENTEGTGNLWNIISTILNFILAIVGVIAVFMIIFGGIQYSTSAGDSGKVKKAKDTILYGIIGLVIALLAAAIVNFVLNGIFSSGEEGGEGASVVTTYVA